MMPMVDCDAVMRQLWDYLDQELTPDRMRAIEAHLHDCERCQPHAALRVAFQAAVSDARDEAGDVEALRERVRLALREEIAPGDTDAT